MTQLETVVAQVKELNPDDRQELIDQMQLGYCGPLPEQDEDATVDLDAETLAMLRRRIAEIDSGEAVLIDEEEFFRRLRLIPSRRRT